MAAARLANHLTQRPERDAIPVRKASAGENVRFTTQTPGHFVDKPGLADSCFARHGHEHCYPVADSQGACGLQPAHLLIPAYQGRIEAERQRTYAWVRGSQEESIGTGAFCFDGRRGKPVCLSADEDLARLGGLREHRCLGSRIPGEPKRPRPAHQCLARRKAEAACQAHAVLPQQSACLAG